MKQNIINYLIAFKSGSASELSRVVGRARKDVQDLLIQMDDDGTLIMKNGIYKLSAASRKRFQIINNSHASH